MSSVTLSHTSTRSKSTKHSRTRPERRPRTPDGIEKLAVKTAGLFLESDMKTWSPRPEIPAETLPMMLADRVRRSRCSPEFLLEMSARDPSEFFEEYGKKLKIITGPEAVTFYKKFLGGRRAADILAEDGVTGVPPCVVFAVAVEDEGRKYADYYTTWPRTESARDPAEAKRVKHLHSQFRKLARVLDNEFKRASIYGVTASSIITETQTEELEEPLIAAKPMAAKAQPPNIFAPPPGIKVDGKVLSPVSATDSVMSLPYLDFIRNVPNGHRIPLRVTNPDNRLSVLSSPSPVTSPTTPTKATQLPVNTSTPENKTNYFPTPTPFSTPAPVEAHLLPVGITKSNSSIRSSRSKDSIRSSTTSTVSKESRSGKHKVNDIPEFLMILLHEKISIKQETRTWHGLERQNSRSTPRSTSRVSLWDGPLARESPHLFAHPPRPDGEESSEDEEDDDNSPIFPPHPSFFGLARSISEPRYAPPMVPPAVQGYRLPSSLGGSPIGSFANLAYGPSPQPPPAQALYPPSPYPPGSYMSPYRSPAVPPMQPTPQSTYPLPFPQE